jgi:DNA-binding NtrC family response regulator
MKTMHQSALRVRDMTSNEQHYRILVVDDDASICLGLEMGLGSQEFEVDVAANGEDGIRLGSSGRYAVLIADLNLPDIDGLQVIRDIKSKHPEIIPIIITGKPTMERRSEGKQVGVHDFLEKPFSLEMIRSAVRHRLAERKRRINL